MSARFTYPVYGFDSRGLREPVATFFAYGDAADFVMHTERESFVARNTYMAAPEYDRRERGYRPAEKPSGYAEWLADLEPKERPDGRFQVAA